MPDTIEHLDDLLVEVAELAGFAELDRAADELPTWWFAQAEGRTVLAEWDDPSQRLMLGTEIASVPEPLLDRVLLRALEYNEGWRSTGGARIGLIPVDKSLQLMIDVHADDLESSHLVDLLARLIEAANSWSEALDELTDQDEHAHDPSGTGGTLRGSMRA